MKWAFPLKEIVPPLLRMSIFFEVDTPWISIQIYRDPPGNPCFFLNFWFPPWNSTLYSTPWNFSLISSTSNFFLENPIKSRKLTSFTSDAVCDVVIIQLAFDASSRSYKSFVVNDVGPGLIMAPLVVDIKLYEKLKKT